MKKILILLMMVTVVMSCAETISGPTNDGIIDTVYIDGDGDTVYVDVNDDTVYVDVNDDTKIVYDTAQVVHAKIVYDTVYDTIPYLDHKPIFLIGNDRYDTTCTKTVYIGDTNFKFKHFGISAHDGNDGDITEDIIYSGDFDVNDDGTPIINVEKFGTTVIEMEIIDSDLNKLIDTIYVEVIPPM